MRQGIKRFGHTMKGEISRQARGPPVGQHIPQNLSISPVPSPLLEDIWRWALSANIRLYSLHRIGSIMTGRKCSCSAVSLIFRTRTVTPCLKACPAVVTSQDCPCTVPPGGFVEGLDTRVCRSKLPPRGLTYATRLTW